jgi:nucleotide sugar dehydrogenase
VLPQIIGAANNLSLLRAEKFLSKIGFNTVKVSSCESAEFIKLISNSWRDATFALSNEIALMSELLGLDSSEVISVANYNYPRSNIPRPGPVGGPCLSKDSYILLESFDNLFTEKSMIADGRFINEQIEINAFNKIKDRLLKIGSSSSILFLGAAFKGSPPTNDTRNGVTTDLIKMLIKDSFKTQILIWDPTISDQDLFEFAHLKIDSLDGIIPNVVVIGNNAKFLIKSNMKFFYSSLPKSTIIIDLWGVTDGFSISAAEIYRLGLGTKKIHG